MSDEIGHSINRYKECPVCHKSDMLKVRNYDETWRDGEVWCLRCEVLVRDYDAG